MGMFDNVNHECVCPVCKSKVDGFQSKSGLCNLDTVEPSEVSNFYSSCKKCGCWIEYTAKKITNFEMTVTGKNDEVLHVKDVSI